MTKSIRAILRGVPLLAGAVALAACSDGGGTRESDVEGPDDVNTPVFPENSGQLPHGVAAYPSGPYGVGKGAIIANYKFVGFANAAAVNDAMQTIRLSDFYNPTGNDVFPEGSPYGAGEPKPKALLVNVSAVWCPPCNDEAENILPGKYSKLRPMGGEFLLTLGDGPTQGLAATPKDLLKWTTKYGVDYPASLDPSSKLAALFEADAYPANLIVRTIDMRVVEVVSGQPDPTFWSTFEEILAQ